MAIPEFNPEATGALDFPASLTEEFTPTSPAADKVLPPPSPPAMPRAPTRPAEDARAEAAPLGVPRAFTRPEEARAEAAGLVLLRDCCGDDVTAAPLAVATTARPLTIRRAKTAEPPSPALALAPAAPTAADFALLFACVSIGTAEPPPRNAVVVLELPRVPPPPLPPP